MTQLRLFPFSVFRTEIFQCAIFAFCVLKFHCIEIAHLRRFRACFRHQCLSQVHQQVNIEKLNVLFLALTPHKGSSSNLFALFLNLYPLLPNLKVSPNLSSWPSPFCLPVLSEAAHLLYSHPTRPDLALQSSESLDGVPWAPRVSCWGSMGPLNPWRNSATPDVPVQDSCTSDLGTDPYDRWEVIL